MNPGLAGVTKALIPSTPAPPTCLAAIVLYSLREAQGVPSVLPHWQDPVEPLSRGEASPHDSEQTLRVEGIEGIEGVEGAPPSPGLEAGSWLFGREGEGGASPQGGEAVHEAPVEKHSWVTICAVDDEENPVAGLRYRLVLPDGRVRTGKLD